MPGRKLQKLVISALAFTALALGSANAAEVAGGNYLSVYVDSPGIYSLSISGPGGWSRVITDVGNPVWDPYDAGDEFQPINGVYAYQAKLLDGTSGALPTVASGYLRLNNGSITVISAEQANQSNSEGD